MRLAITDDECILLAEWKIINDEREEHDGLWQDDDYGFYLTDDELADPRMRRSIEEAIGREVVGEVVIGRKQGHV